MVHDSKMDNLSVPDSNMIAEYLPVFIPPPRAHPMASSSYHEEQDPLIDAEYGDRNEIIIKRYNDSRPEQREVMELVNQNRSKRIVQESVQELDCNRTVEEIDRVGFGTNYANCNVNHVQRIFDPIAILSMVRPVNIILSQFSDGRLILQNYEKRKMLTEYERNKIVDVMVKDLYTLTTQVNNVVLQGLSQKICDYFNTETLTTFYKPPVKKQFSRKGKSEASTGKVPIKWRNLLHRIKADRTCKNAETPNELLRLNVDQGMSENKFDEICRWIERNSEAPIKIIKPKWKEIATTRLERFKLRKNDIGSLWDDWTILKRSDAYELIHSDYASLSLSQRELKIGDWQIFFEKIVSTYEYKIRTEKPKILKQYLTSSDLNPDSQMRAQIELLCYLVPPTAVERPKKSERDIGKKTWKASVENCYSSIVRHTNLASNINHLRNEHENSTKSAQRAAKPYIIVTGSSSSNLDGFYVSVGKALYKLPTFFDAFQTSFKAFHVFSMGYPPEAEHFWLIVQKLFHGFTKMTDSDIPIVETVVNDLSHVERDAS